ncbi:MAG: sterol desaturase family protein [Ilumatobacter sp.]|nr:sterol desaturase family protein [Ilumatobacter sp.]
MDTTWPPPLPAPRLGPPTPTIEADRSDRRRAWLARLAVLSLAAMSIALDLGTLVVVPLLFVVVVPFEKMFPRHRQPIRRPGVRTDIAHALAAPALGVVSAVLAIAIGLASLAWVPGLLLRPLVTMLPTSVMPFVGIALFDMAIYWVHRWSHEVPFLWKFHSVHHSTEHLDWVSGFRNHPFDGAIVAPPFVLLVAAGFDATFTGALAVIQLALGLFLHANVRWRLRPLHRIVVTPEFHHWHHANEADAHNSNYSVFLPIWDMLFGSYFMPRGRRPERYGISESMPMSLVGQLHHPVRGVGNPLRILGRVLRHPWRCARAAARFTRGICADIWRSTTTRRARTT